MSLPSNTFKTLDAALEYLEPDKSDTGNTVSIESGGVAISDGSQGLLVKTWVFQADAETNSIIVYPENDPENVTTFVTSVSNLIDLSGSFDVNMKPAVAYTTSEGRVFFKYYDTLIEDYSTIELPANSRNPKVIHDDKRDDRLQLNVTDVILFYLRDNKVYYRIQRERFETENQIATLSVDNAILLRVGMTTGLRIQLELDGGDNLFVSSP